MDCCRTNSTILRCILALCVASGLFVRPVESNGTDILLTTQNPSGNNNTYNCTSTAAWFDDVRALELSYVAVGCATLSVLGAAFILVTYFMLPKLWKDKGIYGMTLIMYVHSSFSWWLTDLDCQRMKYPMCVVSSTLNNISLFVLNSG